MFFKELKGADSLTLLLYFNRLLMDQQRLSLKNSMCSCMLRVFFSIKISLTIDHLSCKPIKRFHVENCES